jgi:hypothetical protein
MRERYYKITTDSSLTMNQKLQIIEGIKRGVVSIKSKLIELPEIDTPIDLSKVPFYFKIFDHNSKLLGVWTDLTMGNSQPKNLFRNDRLAAIWNRSRQISITTNASFDEIYDDFVEMMSDYLSSFI